MNPHVPAVLGALLLISAPSFAAGVTQHFEIYGAKTAQDLTTLRDWGIDQVILDDSALLRAADDLGLRLIQANWFDRDTDPERVRRRAEEAQALRGLISINLMDEPIFNGADRHPPAYYRDLRAKLDAWGYATPLSLTEHGPKDRWNDAEKRLFTEYFPAVDALRIDPYPVLTAKPLSQVWEWVKEARRLMGDRILPVTVILQTWADGVDDRGVPMLPTIAELRVMAYLAMLAEVDALSFFDFNASVWDQVPGFTSGFAALVGELRTFATATRGYDVAAELGADGVLRATLTSASGAQIQVSVNSTREQRGDLAPLEIRIQNVVVTGAVIGPRTCMVT